MRDCADFDVAVIRSPAGMQELREDWLRLWSDGEHQIYSHPDWIACAFAAYGADAELCVVSVSRHGEIVAVLPGCVRDGELMSAGSPRADSLELLCDGDLAASVLPLMLQALADSDIAWESACLDLVLDGSVLQQSLLDSAAVKRMSGRPLLTIRGEAPYVELHGDREELVRKLAWKKTPRRRRNQLKKQGDLQFTRLTSIDDMQRSIPRITELHRLRREDAGDSSYLADDQGQQFLSSLINQLGPAGLIQIHVLTLDDVIIAGCIGFEAHSRYYYYTPVFDMQWSSLGVGSVLLSFLLEDAIHRGIDVFDFGQGDEGYKSRFSEASVDLYALHLFRGDLRSRLRRCQLSLKEQLRRYPAVFEQVRRVKGLLSGSLGRRPPQTLVPQT